MCGIVGVVDRPTPGRADLLRSMNARIVHRGPDEDGVYEDERVAMAMRRLSIQDVAHGHQPATSESGDVICMLNGEIYNVRELQRLLRERGHRLASESDTECIPHLYEEFGLDFVQHLRGMFAIAIWDRRTQQLILVRDRLGKKPLYYWHRGERLSYGSELKAILADPDLPRVADPVAISHYLTFQYVPAPWSAVQGVKKLPPGHLLVLRGDEAEIRRYWSLDYAPSGVRDERTDDELVEELRENLRESVRLRMISERPLGAFLSGGLDSSAVVAAMSQVGVERIKTFSIGFDEESHNELPYARRVAQHYGTDHHELVVKPDALDVIPRLAASFDEPYADSSAIPSWYLADMAAKHVVVALNGDGGDEALGGYARYQRFLTGSGRRLPRPMASAMLRAGQRLRPYGARSVTLRRLSTGATLLGESDPAHRYARFLSYFRPEEKFELFDPRFADRVRQEDSYALVSQIWAEHERTDVVNRLLAIDTYTYLPGDLLPKVDITTMSVSLEARSPFLDHTFFEWAAAIPGSRKIQNGSAKYLLKRALEGWIDDDLIHRRKQGFAIPLGGWLRGPLRDMVYDTLTDSTAAGRGYFDMAKVRAILDGHMEGVDRSGHIYALLMLELWHREVLG